MFRTRVSIAGLMWAVCLSAVGLAALKSGGDAWSGSIFLLTCGTLAVGVVGIASDAPDARRWWVGFTVFGLGYLFLAFGFRLERLEHLRKSIDDGTYHVSNRNVAAAIVRRGVADVIAKSKSRG